MKKLPGAIIRFRDYRLNRKTLQFWVLRVALDVQCKLLITKHLSEGEENQKSCMTKIHITNSLSKANVWHAGMVLAQSHKNLFNSYS